MASRRNRSVSLRALTPRQVALRATLLFAVAFGASIMVMGRNNQALVGQVRGLATDVLVPVMTVLSKPVEMVNDVGAWFSDLSRMRSENITLKAQNAQLLQWQAVAAELKTENESLRSLIQVVPSGTSRYVAARVVGESGGPFVRAALISGGATDGIVTNQAVIGTEGLVGRVIEAGNNSARILLLTDINSRVPVISETSRERSIASGNNSETLALDYVPASSKIEVGERMLTSGDGGVFPPGIPVGVVTAITGGNVLVQPLTDWTRLEYVSVVDYQF